ncbi:MAG TPA: IPT/TIG domain-containing protein [Planctomycetota bacterium]|nr:IPT/TIG domain-containing protein [Planctomycetota bacterium]
MTPSRKTLGLPALLLLSLLSGAAFAAAPTVTAVSPNAGTIAGGVTVTITGTNFNNPNVTSVTFGGTAATSFTIISGTQISAVTPARAAGAAAVVVNNGIASNATIFYTYTTGNVTLQVTVRVTIPKRADIQWGDGTSLDDAGVNHTLAAQRITPYVWVVSDAALGPMADVATTYLTSDAGNGNKVINVSNVSPTNATNTITGMATNTASWTLGAAVGAVDVFRLRAQMNGGAFVTLSTVAQTLTNNLQKGTDQPLVLEMTTPTTISAGTAGVQQTTTVTLTSTAN